MATNCVKTKFNGILNEDVPKINELLILAKNVPGASLPSFYFSNGYPTPLVVGYTDGTAFDGTLPLNGKTLSIVDCHQLNELKYDSDNIICLGDPTTIIQYTDKMTDLRAYFDKQVNLEGFSKKQDKTLLVQLRISRSYGDIEFLAGYTNLSVLLFRSSTNDVFGDIKDIANDISLSYVSLFYTNIEGSLESFAEGQVLAGRTSGYLDITKSPYMTYDGSTDHTRFYITYDPSLPNGYNIAITQ